MRLSSHDGGASNEKEDGGNDQCNLQTKFADKNTPKIHKKYIRNVATINLLQRVISKNILN